jgi:hypothetical protein
MTVKRFILKAITPQGQRKLRRQKQKQFLGSWKADGHMVTALAKLNIMNPNLAERNTQK